MSEQSHSEAFATPSPAPHPEFWRTPPATSRLGGVALTLAIIIFVTSVALAIALGIAGGPYATRTGNGFNFQFDVGDPDPTINALAIAGILHALIGTGLGLWALIQGIVATATQRGRRYGIAAIVIAAVAPGLSLVAYFTAIATHLPAG